jgi:hypothetical protein
MFRSMTSAVSTFSSFVAKSHQTVPYVSSSPSKIPYVGFSPVRLQTGIQLEPSPDHPSLSTGPAYPPDTLTYIQSQSTFFSSVALPGMFSEDRLMDTPVQRPLAPQPVMLSGQILAYYGLIRNSRPPPSTYGLYDGSWPYGLVWAGVERLPNLIRTSFPFVPPLVPRWTERVPLAVASPLLVAFAISAQARHPQPHALRFSRGKRNEAARFASCYGPEESLALPRQGRLLSSFHLVESPQPNVEYNYAGKQPIPAAGLTPARHAALWAANEGHEEHEGVFIMVLLPLRFLRVLRGKFLLSCHVIAACWCSVICLPRFQEIAL